MVALPLALISYGQAVLLGLLQGVSELFPISSLGHSVILPQLLGWDIHQNDSFFITFLVATHLATALVLLAFFRRDWARIVRGLGRSLRNREIGDDSDARLGWLLVVGTIPAGLLGLLLEHALRDLFASARSAAFFLILNGFMLYGAERLRRRAPGRRRKARATSASPAACPGATRSESARPRRSRSSPASLAPARRWAAACWSGSPTRTPRASPSCSRRRSSARRRCSSCPTCSARAETACAARRSSASLCSALTAYLAVRFLMRYFETNRLTPFAVYCVVAGTASVALLRPVRL